MPTHTVAQGECLTRIAERNGFADWKIIYNHPENAAFRKKRPDPNVIHVGDRIFIPDRETKAVKCPTGKAHSFQLRTPKRFLRLAVEDLAGARMKGASYELDVDGKTYTGATDADGILEQRIAVHAEEATLRVGGRQWSIRIGHLNPMDDAPDEGATGVQARLRNLGYDPGPVDGKVGPRTKSAIRAFQRDNPPLKIDGVCGPRTRAKLVEKHGC
jgi:hypothetical protein